MQPGDKFLLKLKDDWSVKGEAEKVGERKRDQRKEYVRLAGVYSGMLTWKDDECSRVFGVVLGLLLLESGSVSGVKMAEEGDRRTPDAIVDKTRSTWKLRKLGQEVKLDLRLVITTPDKTSVLVECLANPVKRSLQTVTWQILGGHGGYQTGSDFRWHGETIPASQNSLRKPSPVKDVAKKRDLDETGTDDAKRRKTDSSDSTPSVNIFISDTEKARAFAYHKIHGKFPAEIQQRMVSKGLVKKPDASHQNWTEIKETYDKARHKGGDGSLPVPDRNMRINSWLLDVVHPGDRGLDPSEHSIQYIKTPQKPNPGMLPPSTAQPDTSNQRANMWLAANTSATMASPTYGLQGLSPYPHSALADRGDETPAYGELIATAGAATNPKALPMKFDPA